MHLYLIRHGQSFINLKDWKKGNLDEGLTPLGQRQADALSCWLPGEIAQIDALYASTMRRAQETTQPIATMYDIPIINDDRLREVGNNRLDHTPWPSDDLPEYGSFWGSERPFATITPTRELGESLMHFRVRVGHFIEELIEKHREQIVVAVCHGGVIELAFDHMFNIGPFRRCEVWSKNTGIAHFEYVEHPSRETWRLHYHGCVEHLQDLVRTDGRGSGEFDGREASK
ncbi:MAG: histidine phosphatase family protein [Chloroflexi bacterium]|nr:histidine phosphatase family protein [Chloroflexota bacterium]